jgi:ActR/RegA family two-component response regulator
MAVVLVVEDDRVVANALCRHLELRGHLPVVAGSAAQARILGIGRRPDAAILDLRLPDGDGLTTFGELKQRWPSLIGVMLTGFGSVPSAVASLQAGMADYVEKPTDLTGLVIRIETLVAAAAQGGVVPGPGAGTSASAVRVARLVARAIDSLAPPRTLAEWGLSVGVARSTLRTWCRVIGVHPHDVLCLLRGVWALEHAPTLGVAPVELLGYLNPRSTRDFVIRGGLPVDHWQTLTPVQFCLEQQFCRNKLLVSELVWQLSERAGLR